MISFVEQAIKIDPLNTVKMRLPPAFIVFLLDQSHNVIMAKKMILFYIL